MIGVERYHRTERVRMISDEPSLTLTDVIRQVMVELQSVRPCCAVRTGRRAIRTTPIEKYDFEAWAEEERNLHQLHM